jgi:HD superfamily phosphohydrolase
MFGVLSSTTKRVTETAVQPFARKRASFSPKKRLIKDPVWGNLEIFEWENGLLNHFLFNRLHNIVQNSSAYKVYPGLKYSRFLHSVGVAHVATQLFENIATTSEGAARAALLKEARALRAFIPVQLRKGITQTFGRSTPCPTDYLIMLAAVRVTALVHDIGHLPFSHVFENAIDGFRRGMFGDALRLTKDAQEQQQHLKNLLNVREALYEADTKLHEILGYIILEILQDDLARNTGDILLAGLIRAALEILTTSNFPIAKGLISGTIDADRIDFIRRDGFFSGLFNSSVDYGRMFAFYELARHPENGLWLPRPSARTLSETEKLLLERFLDYKCVVVHHTVHLFDEIMENVLVRLMANGALSDFVKRLCELLELPSHKPRGISGRRNKIDELQSLLTEFDDPWLEVAIRQQYAELKQSGGDITHLFLHAYVEDRHCFKSAFKTDEDFQKFCSKYAPQLLRHDPVAIRTAFGAPKYALQNALSKHLQRIVIIGPTDRKLNFGIHDLRAAEFVSVSSLYQYFVGKKIQSCTFNFWYERLEDDEDSPSEHERIVAKALDFLRKIVVKQMEFNDGDKQVA